jgi:hypothetical protein
MKDTKQFKIALSRQLLQVKRSLTPSGCVIVVTFSAILIGVFIGGCISNEYHRLPQYCK